MSAEPLALTERVREELVALPQSRLVLQLTCLFYAMYCFAGEFQLFSISIGLVCVVMLLSPALRSSRATWLALAGIMGLEIALRPHTADNHMYLFAYWFLACGLAVAERDSEELLRFNGRLLVGLVFGYAALWKLLAGEYLDGSFFHYTLLTDERFISMAAIAGGLPPALLEENARAHQLLRLIAGPGAVATLHSSEALRIVSLLCCYWTLAIEWAIAFSFLLRQPRWLCEARHAMLLLFLCTTYLIAPITSFSSVLAILGLAQCPPERGRLRLLYLGVFLLLQFTTAVPRINLLVRDWLVGA